jgi:hypothetical protein
MAKLPHCPMAKKASGFHLLANDGCTCPVKFLSDHTQIEILINISVRRPQTRTGITI